MIVLRKRCLRVVLLWAFAVPAMVATMPSRADDTAAKPAVVGASPSGPSTPILRPARPYWLDLTPPQREALGPLTNDWEHLDFQTKKKWVEIANRYPKMKPEEQTHTQERMREWALLTPEQRRVARDSYERIKAMPPEQRADMLRKYRELPPEKREALASQAQIGKAIVMPKAPTTAPPPVTRRTQIREGATVRNPAIAAQKSASPVVAPPHAPKPAAPPAPAPAASSAPVAPALTPATGSGSSSSRTPAVVTEPSAKPAS